MSLMAWDIVNNGEQTVGRAEYSFGGWLVLSQQYREQHWLFTIRGGNMGKKKMIKKVASKKTQRVSTTPFPPPPPLTDSG